MHEQVRAPKINILIVDDMMVNLIMIAKVVTKLGYLARPVITMKQAREALQYELPDVILLDVSMPEGSGFDFCNELKLDPRYRNIPVIFITGYDANSYKLRAYQVGAVDYIVKPFYHEELAYKVKFYVENGRKQRQMRQTIYHLQQLLQERNEEKRQEKKSVYDVLHIFAKEEKQEQKQRERMSQYARELASNLQLCEKFEEEIDEAFLDCLEAVAPLYEQKNETLLQVAEALLERDPSNEYLQMAVEVASHRQEEYERTPLSARIIGIISAYLQGSGLKGIQSEAGRKFDPDIVLIFTRLEAQFRERKSVQDRREICE